MKTLLKVAFGTLAVCIAGPAWADGADWAVSEASGRVVVRDGAGDHPVARGTVVHAGATLVTGAGSRAVLVRGDDFVTVSAASRVRLPDAQAPGLVQMFLEWGTGLFKVKHTDKPHFGVQTPYLAAVVKGTTFTVTVGNEGSSLQVLDGAVGVATIDGGANELVRPGMVAMIGANDRYRLTLQGQESRTIDSPLRATAPTAKTGDSPKTVDSPKIEDSPKASATGSRKGSDDFAWSDVSNSVITQPVEAKPVDLGAATGGLVSNGANSPSVAMSAVVPVARGNDKVPAGSGNGKDGGHGNAKGNGNDTDHGKGSGTDNGAGGPGNGNGSGGPGNGKGSGGPGNGKGSGGPGNGNGTDQGKGGGPDNGPGGAGNGNGKADGGGNGTKDGNAGDSNGNGNANSGAGNSDGGIDVDVGGLVDVSIGKANGGKGNGLGKGKGKN